VTCKKGNFCIGVREMYVTATNTLCDLFFIVSIDVSKTTWNSNKLVVSNVARAFNDREVYWHFTLFSISAHCFSSFTHKSLFISDARTIWYSKNCASFYPKPLIHNAINNVTVKIWLYRPRYYRTMLKWLVTTIWWAPSQSLIYILHVR
jgi:hypothetical protein